MMHISHTARSTLKILLMTFIFGLFSKIEHTRYVSRPRFVNLDL